MIIDSKYIKTFLSNDLTRLKYNELYKFATTILNHKNKVSEYVSSDLQRFLDYNKFSFLKEMRVVFKNEISSSFDAQIYQQIFDSYQNKFDTIQRKLKFEQIIFQGFELYKRDTKNNKIGELKSIKFKHNDTELSTCLTYLARYGNVNILDYIKSNIDSCDEKKKMYYENILRCCDKFGFERLYKLALQKRNRIIKKYSEYPIEFKSLTFSGRCRKKKIVDYNKNYGSEINSFISLSGINRKSFDIPVKFSKEYHGNMKDFYKNNNDYEYILTFNENNKQVNIHICKEGERYIPNAGNNLVGIDVNCKHNLFSLSNESTYDYNRKLVNDYCKLSLEIDKLKQNREYVVGKRKQNKLNVLKNKMIKSEQQLIALMCKDLQQQGFNHIIMEDLDNSFGRSKAKDIDNDDINYNRKVSFLGLSSLKQEVEHISRKYDIAVSTVHSSYTSKMCPICGCIEDNNRKNQEEFKCIECGYENNADYNASINIKNRVCEAVLRNALLKQLDNNSFEPRKLKRENVKEVLLSFRKDLIKKSRSEGKISGLTTFNYF